MKKWEVYKRRAYDPQSKFELDFTFDTEGGAERLIDEYNRDGEYIAYYIPVNIYKRYYDKTGREIRSRDVVEMRDGTRVKIVEIYDEDGESDLGFYPSEHAIELLLLSEFDTASFIIL